MKRVGGVIVGCLLAAVVALGVLLGVTYTENARLKGDFSYLYVEPTVGVLEDFYWTIQGVPALVR